MANNGLVYDKDADTENSPIQHAKSNDQGAENKSLDSNSLNESESGGLYKPDDSVSAGSDSDANDTLGKGFTGNKKGALKSRLLSSRRNKMILLGLGGSGAGAVLVVVLLLLIASSLKIPNLAQHITSYEFARITRQFSENAQRITGEKLVLSSALDGNSKLSFAEQVKAKYPSLAKASDTLAKLDSYRPENVIKTLGQDNSLRLNFTNSKFTGSTLDGTTFSMKSAGKITGKVPLLRDVIDFKGQLQFSRDFVPALDSAMKLNDVGPIIRGATARQIRQRLGIGLIAWNLGKFQGKDAVQARLEEEKAKIKAVDSNLNPTASTTENLKNTQKGIEEAVSETVADDSKLQTTIDNGGVAPAVQTSIENSMRGNVFDTTIRFANPVYGVAVPLCIVYDGSMEKSDGTINNSTRQQQAAFYYIASAADQQKQGSTNSANDQNLAKAVNATNSDLGNISNTTPELRASGGAVDTTTNGISAEAGASGQYTLFNATLGNNDVVASINKFITPVCSTLTNIKLAVGFAILNGVVAFGTFGESAVIEGGVEVNANIVVNAVTKSVTERLISKVVGKDVLLSATNPGRVAKLVLETGKDTLKNGVKIAGATILAKLVVLSRSAQLNSGFSQGEDLANMAASGGNIQANELSRQQLFGRPLTTAEVAQSDQVDSQFIAYQNQSKSFTNRYLATSNADSLISHMAMSVSATFHSGFVASLIKLGGYILQPFTHFGALFGSLIGSVHAAPDPNTQHYGNVQFGWSHAEENLINNDASYQPLENQAILDASVDPSGKPSKIIIAQTYAQCFGYTADDGGNLTPVSSNSGIGTLGDLLSTGMIKRDAAGNVLSDDSKCSPVNLGKPMVMRWRLAMSYGTTLDQLTAMQNVTN